MRHHLGGMDVSPALRQVIDELEQTGFAVEVVDPEWRLVWISSQLREMVGDHDDQALGIGQHYLVTRDLPVWEDKVLFDEPFEISRRVLPYMAYDTPGGVDALRERIGPSRAPSLEGIEPREPPLVAHWRFRYLRGGLPPASGMSAMIRFHAPDGQLVGTALLLGPVLPASVLDLVARGDARVFQRMAELIEPGRHAAAILFADLESSGELSRRLSSSAYFRLIRDITSAFDAAVGDGGGIVGKHAGDGVTAFFLSEQAGSDSAAARAALEVARAASEAARRASASLAEEGVRLDAEGCRLNTGVHWGGALYMGQVVTDGRLEVTALGDAVNEAARLEQAARDGAVLASKALLERLSDEDARALGIDLDALGYTTVSELDSAGPKAVRDAGTIPVADVRDALLAAAGA